MKPRHERAGVDLGRQALLGVGDVRGERLDWGNAGGCHVVHVRRPVRAEEEPALPPWFLTCPVIDMGGFRPLVLR